MKAIILREPGGPEQLRLDDVPLPVPEWNQVLVKLKAAALNRRDLLVRSREQYRAAMPFIPGSDGAGVVIAVGPAVSSTTGWRQRRHLSGLELGQHWKVRQRPILESSADPITEPMPNTSAFRQRMFSPCLVRCRSKRRRLFLWRV